MVENLFSHRTSYVFPLLTLEFVTLNAHIILFHILTPHSHICATWFCIRWSKYRLFSIVWVCTESGTDKKNYRQTKARFFPFSVCKKVTEINNTLSQNCIALHIKYKNATVCTS